MKDVKRGERAKHSDRAEKLAKVRRSHCPDESVMVNGWLNFWISRQSESDSELSLSRLAAWQPRSRSRRVHKSIHRGRLPS
jgi:hypothetical protein